MKKVTLIFSLALLFASCNKEKLECPGSPEKTFAITGFTTINAGDAHHVSIVKGNEFSIKAKGCTSDLNDLVSLDANHILDSNTKFINRTATRLILLSHYLYCCGLIYLVRLKEALVVLQGKIQ